MVVMVHREEGEEGEPEETLYRHLLHLCHLDLQAKGLSTGYSKDVHGEVRVTPSTVQHTILCAYRLV